MRRHGQLEVPEEQKTVKQLLGTAKDHVDDLKLKGGISERLEVERKLKERAAKGRQ